MSIITHRCQNPHTFLTHCLRTGIHSEEPINQLTNWYLEWAAVQSCHYTPDLQFHTTVNSLVPPPLWLLRRSTYAPRSTFMNRFAAAVLHVMATLARTLLRTWFLFQFSDNFTSYVWRTISSFVWSPNPAGSSQRPHQAASSDITVLCRSAQKFIFWGVCINLSALLVLWAIWQLLQPYRASKKLWRTDLRDWKSLSGLQLLLYKILVRSFSPILLWEISDRVWSFLAFSEIQKGPQAVIC